ncbi:MAG TPA: polysaccharide deacetylase [Roseiflexaceae bacterium]
MGKRRTTVTIILLAILLLGTTGLALFTQRRVADCAYVPLLAGELLPNAGLAPGDSPGMPQGWGRGANGVELQGAGKGFDYDGDSRALQLIGIGNYVQTPPIGVRPGASYCFAGRALTDSDKHSTTRLRVVFAWRDAQGQPLGEDRSDWQPVVLWQPSAPPADWSRIRAAFMAPDGAATLLIRLQPASDDRVYLDAMHVRRGGDGANETHLAPSPRPSVPPSVAIQPWPNGYRAALSFSFDWETTMGGLIHSRSLASDDPNNADDPRARGLRMREGITTTLELSQPYDIRATYYATGYNFLGGNPEKQTFMDDPTFAWANKDNGWKSDWSQRPWFSTDPHSSIQSDPDYYFADLTGLLQRDRQDIQSHTFSHLYGGYASPQEWRADLQSWRAVAAERVVPMARSLAFPWSSSAGMSDDSWRELEAAGITSVTRTNWSQPAYRLADRSGWRCLPVPGHETILACPDFYLIAGRITPPGAKVAQMHAGGGPDEAIRQIDQAIAQRGMIDIWAHTEEATAPAQIADWQAVVGYAARQRDTGTLWIAPLAEIADWQQALRELTVQSSEFKVEDAQAPLKFTVTNGSAHDLNGLTLDLPFETARYTLGSKELKTQNSKPWPEPGRRLKTLVIDMRAGTTLEVQAWPA